MVKRICVVRTRHTQAESHRAIPTVSFFSRLILVIVSGAAAVAAIVVVIVSGVVVVVGVVVVAAVGVVAVVLVVFGRKLFFKTSREKTFSL